MATQVDLLHDRMLPCVALVSISGPDPRELKHKHRPFYNAVNGNTTLSASGIIVQNNYILTSGALITPFLQDRTNYSFDNDDLCVSPPLVTGATITVYIEGFKPKQVKLCCLIRNANADKYIDQLIQENWYWGWNEAHTTTNMNRSTPSQFALLHLDTTSTKLKSIPLSTKATIRQGDDVYVVSSPFGILTRETFQNSVTKGIVSNNITTRDGAPLAILTDARMLPGSEGGAVFRASTGELLAVCTLPLRRHDSIVEMNIAIAFSAVVPPLFHYIESHHLTLLAPSPALAIDSVSTYAPMVVDQAKQKVVYLHVGNAWSTGIIVSDSGHILTNAHLVKPFLKPNSMELVDHTQIVAMVTSDIGDLNKNRKLYAASIISVSLQGSYDIALLHIDKKTKDYFNLAHRTELRRGMDVFVVGYPLFQPLSTSGAIRRPTCTKGTLASIVHTRDKTPCLVQTSALVHMGNSGGAIINDHGELVGLVTSNIKHLNDRSPDSQKKEKLIPSMNFSIPPHALHPIVDYLSGRIDVHALQEWVDTNDEHVEKIWKLTGTLETKKIRKSKFMTIMEKQKKGERDSSFIASRL